MKKPIEIFLSSFVYPLIVALIMFAIGIGGSGLLTGKWDGLLKPTSQTAVIFFCSIFISIIIFAIYYRIKRINRYNGGPGVTFLTTPLYGWQEVGKCQYKGVIWVIERPAPSPIEGNPPIFPYEVKVSTPPLCPECKTEIEENKRFIWGYRWLCIKCGFSKINRDSIYRECDRVEKIVRAEIKNNLSSRNAV